MNVATAIYPSLRNRHVLITGGATGIGAALINAFADQGARIAFVDIAEEAGEVLAENLAKRDAHVVFSPVDVTDVASLQHFISQAEARLGGVHVLINNVANDTRHDWRTLSVTEWDRLQSINLRPSFFTIQAVLPGMLSREAGSIINIGSVTWKAKQGGMPAYSAAKAAIHGLTRSFMEEAGRAGVRVNTVIPGWVMTTRQLALHMNDESRAVLKRNQALRGTISPEQLASLALYLAADDSSMCTGQEFILDGGWT